MLLHVRGTVVQLVRAWPACVPSILVRLLL
jgi:hypothetical protein